MKRVLLTGMSGTGKSTVIRILGERGYKAVDTDDDWWCEWVNGPDGPDCIWHEGRMRWLLATEDADVLFVSGTHTNQGTFYPWFDHIILLSAPEKVMRRRIATRTTNDYGKAPDELADILGYVETVEPLLRATATFEIDTCGPVDEVVRVILDHIQLSDNSHG